MTREEHIGITLAADFSHRLHSWTAKSPDAPIPRLRPRGAVHLARLIHVTRIQMSWRLADERHRER